MAAAKQILLTQYPDLPKEKVFALVNCTGLSARHFVGEEEGEKLLSIRGQTILVRGEAAMARTCTDFLSEDKEELVYVIPRPVRIIGKRKLSILDSF